MKQTGAFCVDPVADPTFEIYLCCFDLLSFYRVKRTRKSLASIIIFPKKVLYLGMNMVNVQKNYFGVLFCIESYKPYIIYILCLIYTVIMIFEVAAEVEGLKLLAGNKSKLKLK